MQKRTHSLIEASLNTASGFVISLAAGVVVFPLFGWEVTAQQNFMVVCIFTAISVVRSYVWRRVFNHRRKPTFDLIAHVARQRAFSLATFGPGMRTEGLCNHIRLKLDEIAREPYDLTEWIDVVILALDGAHRTGAGPQIIAECLAEKQEKNEACQWPDWRTIGENAPIEHLRAEERYRRAVDCG